MVLDCRALDPLALLVAAGPLAESRLGAGWDSSEAADPPPPP